MKANMADTTTGALAPLSFHSTAFDIVDRNGQPWLRAAQIAQALGYIDDSSINRIYARRAAEFTDAMTCSVKLTDQTEAGQARDVRIFSLRGAHLLAMFARTALAAEFRRWVLDVLEGRCLPATAPAPKALPLPAPEPELIKPKRIPRHEGKVRAVIESVTLVLKVGLIGGGQHMEVKVPGHQVPFKAGQIATLYCKESVLPPGEWHRYSREWDRFLTAKIVEYPVHVSAENLE
jgi:hypothetical protein